MPPPRAPLWTSDEIVAACGPLVTGPPLAAPFVASGISIDTRTLAPGDLFVALQGATHRGETFLDSAFHKGAAGALVMAPTDDPRAIHVHDTTQALSALGKAARNRFTTTQVVGVTGSVGKSGTKEALRHVLSAYGTTHASQASLNNHWGLPLSLARIPPSAAFAVLEMGMNHPGEIAAHTQITRPHVALITRIGQAHTGHFPHLQAIADAKGEIFLGVPLDGTAVLNRDDPFFEHLFQKAQNLEIPHILSFGRHPQADVRLIAATSRGLQGSDIHVTYQGAHLQGTLAHPGAHWVSNALGVLAVCAALNLDLAHALPQLASLPPLPGRGRTHTLTVHGQHFLLIDDSYNANPTSMAACLDLLAALPCRGQKIALLGDMYELGASAAQEHSAIAQRAQEAKIGVLTCGALMQEAFAQAPSPLWLGYAPTPEDAARILLDRIQEGDIVAVKASHSVGLERTVQLILETAQPTA